jgi:hypothetical protein
MKDSKGIFSKIKKLLPLGVHPFLHLATALGTTAAQHWTSQDLCQPGAEVGEADGLGRIPSLAAAWRRGRDARRLGLCR